MLVPSTASSPQQMPLPASAAPWLLIEAEDKAASLPHNSPHGSETRHRLVRPRHRRRRSSGVVTARCWSPLLVPPVTAVISVILAPPLLPLAHHLLHLHQLGLHALVLKPEPRLIPAAFEDRIAVKRWEALGDGIAEATVLITHDLREPADRRQPEKWYEAQRGKIRRGLAMMERELGDGAFCYGNAFTLADIAAGYALGYLDAGIPGCNWRAASPRLARHYDKLVKRVSFIKTDPATT